MKTMYKSKKFSVISEEVEMNNGKLVMFEYVWRRDGTRSIIENDKGKILLTKEYRYELGGYDWRVPGGKIDDDDENIQSAAARELKEETGIEARDWTYLWPSMLDSTIRFQRHFLYGKDLVIGEQNLDEGEDIKPYWFTKDEVIKMSLNGDIKEEISALSFLKLFLHK